MYFEALDAVINAMEDHFEQPALKNFLNVEQLFLKTINNQDASVDMKAVKPISMETSTRISLKASFI